MTQYHLTPTAFTHLQEVVRTTARKWGLKQAKAYEASLEEGFKEIAREGKTIMTDFRAGMVRSTDFSLHLVEHHYVPFVVLDEHHVIIAGLFHERMNIRARLNELHSKGRDEIALLAAEIRS